MPIKVKDLTKSANKWVDRARGAAASYAEEAAVAGDVWARNTAAAKETYKLAITAPGIADRFGRGVSRAGAAKYQRKIESVGKERFGPGVAAAEEDYKANVEPFLSTIAGLTLPARKPRGDPANYMRVQKVGEALNAKRLAQLAGGGA